MDTRLDPKACCRHVAALALNFDVAPLPVSLWAVCAVPSLLAIPLLGWSGYDRKLYATTRQRLLSAKNR